MKETPIIYSTPMVRAYLDGRETMTRRTYGLESVNQIPNDWQFVRMEGDLTVFRLLRKHWSDILPFHSIAKEIRGEEPNLEFLYKCPYGQVGDVLWGRETHWYHINYQHDVKPIKPQKPIWFFVADGEPEYYKFKQGFYRKYPSIFMPRWASRITQTITEIRVERLQDITPEDCLAEGIGRDWTGSALVASDSDLVKRYSILWDSFNAKRCYSWESNPWVWVIKYPAYKES